MSERMIELRGMRFCLSEWGEDGAPVTVILHGWMDQGASWARVGRAVAEAGHCVIAPDHRGHGRSDHTPPGSYYHFPDYIADVDALIRALGVEQVDLIGHSMGGTVACWFAALRPERVRSLVLVEGLGPPAVDAGGAVDQYRAHLDQIIAVRAPAPMDDLAAAAARMQRLNPHLPAEEARRLAARATTTNAQGQRVWRWDPLHRTRAAIAFDLPRFQAALARITAPTTLIFGQRSWYMGLPELPERIACLPNVVHRADLPTGHSPHMEAPQVLSEALRQALAR